MFWPREDDDDNDGVYFHNPMEDMARMVLFQQMMMQGAFGHPGASGEGCQFMKVGNHVRKTCIMITIQTFFSCWLQRKLGGGAGVYIFLIPCRM